LPEALTQPAPAAARAGLYVRLALVAAFWGGQFIAGRVAAPMAPHFTTGALRFLLACMAFVALAYWREGGLPRPTAKQWPALLALGFAGIFGYNAFFFAGLQTVPAGRAALMMALIPIGTTLGAWLFFGERMTPVRLLGIALSLAGAAVVISHGDLAALIDGALGHGELLLLGSVLSWVAYTLIGRTGPKGLSPLATTTWAALVGTVLLCAVAVFEAPWSVLPRLPMVYWTAIVYLALLGTVAAFIWYLEGVRAIGGPRTAVFINLVPVFGVAFAALLLGESILPSMVLGGAMVIAGVLLTNRPAPVTPPA
jgi:drug/metabolite transporter (DMT)-like permease